MSDMSDIPEENNNLSTFLTLLSAILRGEKPRLFPNTNPLHKMLIAQLNNLYDAGLLMEPTWSYVWDQDNDHITATSTQEEQNQYLAHKGLTGLKGLEPFPKNATTAQGKILKNLQPYDKDNGKIKSPDIIFLGNDQAKIYRKIYAGEQSQQQIQMPQHPAILTNAGLVGLYEFVTLAEHVKNAKLTNLAADAPNADQDIPPIFLHNHHNIWSPFANFFKDDLAQAPLHHVTTIKDIKEKLTNIPNPAHMDEDIQNITAFRTPGVGTILWHGSKNQMKLGQMRESMAKRANGLSHQSLPFPIIGEAEETSRSYAGNVTEKLRALYATIETLIKANGQDGFASKYLNGKDAGEILIFLEDKGLEIDGRYLSGNLFSAISADRSNPYRSHAPGPEYKGLMEGLSSIPYKGNSGVQGIVDRIFERRNEIEAEQDEQFNPSSPIKAIEKSCAAWVYLDDILASIKKNEGFDAFLKAHRFLLTHAQTTNMLHPAPLGEDISPNDTDTNDFLVPLFEGNDKSQKQEGAKFIQLYGLMAEHLKTFERETGTTDRKGKFPSQDLTEIPEGTTILGFADLHPNGNVVEYDLESGAIGSDKTGSIKTPSALHHFHIKCRDADIFDLSENDDITTNNFWEKLFTLTSLFVGGQIGDYSVKDKPLIIMRNNPLMQILYGLKESGMVNQDFKDLAILLDDNETDQSKKQKILSALSQAQTHTQDKLPPYEYKDISHQNGSPHSVNRGLGQSPISPANRNPAAIKLPRPRHYQPIRPVFKATALPDHFTATIYCSATSTNEVQQNQINHFAQDLAKTGIAIKTGGGKGLDGHMARVNDGQKSASKKHRLARVFSYLTCHHSTETATSEGTYDQADFYDILPSIYFRMESLQKTNIELAIAGGIGTVQEIAASMLMRKWGLIDAAETPFILVNQDGVYDNFLKQLTQLGMSPAQLRNDYNMHIVDNLNQAKDLITNHHGDKNIGADKTVNPRRYIRPNNNNGGLLRPALKAG